MKLTKKQLETIKAELSKLEDFLPDILDEMVHEGKSQEASEINNQGEDAQLKYIASGFNEFRMLLAYMGLTKVSDYAKGKTDE